MLLFNVYLIFSMIVDNTENLIIKILKQLLIKEQFEF
jgi:hypothetical protein